MFYYSQVREHRFANSLPTYELIALHANMNRKKGAQPFNAIDFMPPFLVPDRLRNPDRVTAQYSGAVVDAFELALKLRFVSNGVLAALNTRALRASGATF